MVGLAFGNSPAAMPAWGGKRALFGTNPIAAIFPRKSRGAAVIDLSLSEVARGKVMVAAQQGRPIPLGWALDRDGQPDHRRESRARRHDASRRRCQGRDARADRRTAVRALTGAHFGFEADSFFVDEGNQPRLGQAFLVIDPAALAGVDVITHESKR